MNTPPSATGTLVGTPIGNYVVRQLLGHGAMGEVYLAEHPAIGREVAIKVLLPALSVDAEVAERFVAEAQAVNRINHPNIIQVFDFGRLEDGRLYFTMERLVGQPLTALLAARAPLPLAEVDPLLHALVGALDSAHDKGIIHRDLKPDNIFLCDGPQGPSPKILDFGIAKLTDADGSSGNLTAAGAVLGTPLYMSPEQAAGRTREVSPQSDLYALGVILYQMLSGDLPVKAPTLGELLAKHVQEPHIPLEHVARDLPPGLYPLVNQCLAKEPTQRPASAGILYRQFRESSQVVPEELATAVDPAALAATEYAPPPAPPAPQAPQAGLLEAPTTLRGAAAEVQVGPPPSTKRRKRGPLVVVVLAAVLVVAAGAGVALWMNQRPGPAARSGVGRKAPATDAAVPPDAAPAARPAGPPDAAAPEPRRSPSRRGGRPPRLRPRRGRVVEPPPRRVDPPRRRTSTTPRRRSAMRHYHDGIPDMLY